VKEIQPGKDIRVVDSIEGGRAWIAADVWHKLAIISLKKWDIPCDLARESGITCARCRWVPEIKYFELYFILPCDILKPGGIILNWMSGNDGKAMARR
jgi:hypothetical protein